ncbi:DUF742 domain-containing protein [Amycolatopsis lurida]
MSTGPGYGRERDDGTFADVLNGFTLDSGRGRRKRKKDKDGHAHVQSADAPPPETRGQAMTPPPAPVAEILAPHNPLFDTGQQQRVPPHGHPAYQPPPVPEPPPAAEETAIVRPYALTGGRTKANYVLELETLISTNTEEVASFVPDQIEQTSIVEECRTPRSVAELASTLRVPLGVARVLISDAADAGLVIVHKTASGSENDEAHLILMERVLSGLRRL